MHRPCRHVGHAEKAQVRGGQPITHNNRGGIMTEPLFFEAETRAIQEAAGRVKDDRFWRVVHLANEFEAEDVSADHLVAAALLVVAEELHLVHSTLVECP